MNESDLRAARKTIREAQRILIASHIRPDGDAVGSLLGLGLALQDAGKEIQMVLSDEVPKSFHHLQGSNQISRRPDGVFDTIIVVDCSGLDRVGDIFANENFTPDINIDHHVSNQNFARINLVEHEATATAEMLSAYLPALGLTLTRPIAEALLTGILTDTIGFRTTNMRSDALRQAAALMDLGCNLPLLYEKALNTHSFEEIRYWGAGLSSIQIEDRLVWATLRREDRHTANYPGLDDADLINILTTIKDADIALIFIEQPQEYIKVSWRARPGFDVAKLAAQFGGGGHKPAAGATIEGELQQVQTEVLAATMAVLNE